MESITIKVDDEMAVQIDKAMKPLYTTKTEFIREAIREKIKKISTEEAIRRLTENFGKSKVKTPLWKDEIIREKALQELLKERGLDLD